MWEITERCPTANAPLRRECSTRLVGDVPARDVNDDEPHTREEDEEDTYEDEDTTNTLLIAVPRTQLNADPNPDPDPDPDSDPGSGSVSALVPRSTSCP